jgi:hypothetical protein
MRKKPKQREGVREDRQVKWLVGYLGKNQPQSG